MEKKTIDREFVKNRLQKMTRSSTIKWGRSKIMIVGEGRAGKSALANSLLGKTFAPTESTVGITEFSCRIGKFTGSAEDRTERNRYDKADKELEMLVAKSLKAEFDFLLAENIIEDKMYTESLIEGHSKEEIDEETVWRCLQNEIMMSTKYLLSIFDFGGQSVFNVIHPFFLTSYGVYLVVFNMEWMEVDMEISKLREQCFSYLKFWLNSIIIHTQRSEGMLAPILLIGTRKDRITEPAKHSKISRLLHKEFSNNIAISYIQQNRFGTGANGTATLMFFPVDNTLSDKDPMIESIMSTIERCLDEADYPHLDIPISWIKVYDQLKVHSKSCITLSTMKEMVNQYISHEELIRFLKFLHELGLLMWHQEEILSKQIILDPIEYFVTPATTIICRHIPSDEDETVHVKPIHTKCQQLYFDEWISLVQKGILSHRLLIALLQDYSHYEKIIVLLIKYSLIVSLSPFDYLVLNKTQDQQHDIQAVMQNCKYVVPALLPSQKENNMVKPFSKKKFSEKEKLYFIFTPNNMITDHLFNLSDCSKVGFLPSGLFERLLAKSVAWCIETSAYEVGSRDGVMNWNYQDYHFDRSEAFLSYGNQFFILKLELEYNAISLIIDGPNKKWIYDRVLEQLQSMISECMDCLEVVCGLSWKHSLNPVCLEDEYDDNDQSINEEEDATTKLEDRKIASMEEESTKIKEAMKDCLLKYESIEQCITNSKYLNFSMHGKVYQIPSMNLQTNYEFWMKRRNALDKYDIFISYRWGGSHHHFDSNLAKGIFDGLSGRLVDNPKRSIETFLDIQRLQEGRRFDADFSRALSNSLIFVPLVSSYALTRMLYHDPMKVDNVLAEWIIGLDCYSRFENETSMEYSIQLQRIYPIFIGSQMEEGDDANSQGNMKNLFEESILDELPKIVPVATIEMIEKNLNRPLLHVYKAVTVHEVVNTLKKFLCINAFEIVHGSVLTNKLIPWCFVRLSKSLRGLLVEIQAKKNEKNDIIIEKNDIVLETTESYFSDEQSTFTNDFECLAALYLSEKIDECQAIVRYGRKLLSQSQKIVAHKLYFLYCLELINFTSLFSENIRIPIQKLMDTFTPSRDWGQRNDNVSIIESKSAKENGRGAFSSTGILATPTEVIQGASKDRLEVEWTMISMIDRVIEIHYSQNLVEAAVDLLPGKDLVEDRLHKELKQMKQQLSSARQDLQQAQENLEKKSQVTIPVAVMEENAEIINLKKQIEMVVNEYQEIEKNLIETTKSLQTGLVERELYKGQIKDWTKQFQVENGREPEVNDKALIRDKFQIYKNTSSKVKEFEGIVQPLEKQKKEKALQIQQLEKELEKQLVLIAGPLEAGGQQRLSLIDQITVASVTVVENCKPKMTDITRQQFEEIMQKHNEVLEQLDNQIFDLKEQLSKLKLVNQEIETEKNFINQHLQALIKEKRTDVLKRFEDELAELNKKSTELNETVTRLTIDKEKLDTRVTELKERAESAEHELRERDAREQHSLQPNDEQILLKEQIKKQRDQIILKSKAATAGWDAATLANDRLETEVQSAYQKGLKEEREKHKLDGIHEALEGKESRITELLVSIAEMEKKVMKTESEKKEMEEYIEDLKLEVAIAISGIQQIAAANICGGTGDGHLKQNGELVIPPSAAELEQAHEQLDVAHEELVGLMDRCDRLEVELEISRRKNRLFERLATMTGLTSGKAATVGKSGDSNPKLSKYDLDDVVQTVKRAITKGTNLWKSNLKDQCYDVYLDACVEITQRIISEDLSKPVFESIERGKSLGAQNRQRGAVPLRKALDKFIADAALPNCKNNEETAVANARAKTNQSSAIDEENEISNATVKELVERLENMESSFIKQGYTKENNPSNSSAAGTEEHSPRENQSGASLLLRAKTAEAEVQSLRKQLALIISASTPSTGTIAGVGVAKSDNGDESNFDEVQDLQYKIRYLEKQLKNWRKDPLPYWEKLEDCISLQKCLQFFLDYLQNKTAFQSEVQAISFKFKQSPSLIPNHLKVHDKLPVHRKIEKEEANQSSSHSLQKQFLQLHQKLEKLNNSSSVEVLEIAPTIEGQDSSEKKLNNEINSLKRERKSIEMRAVKAENSLQKIEESYNTIVSERDTLKSENAKLVETKNERENIILEKLSKESILRKKYKNELEDLKGSIRVYARCRPMAKYELEKGCRNMVEFKDETSMKLITSRGEKEFEFDAVFSPSSTQEQIFEETKRLLESCIDGFNIAMFAYGQTGAGKTFTMAGSPSNPGLTPRAIDELYRLIGERVHVQVKVTSYFVELYNDNLVDLFYILDKGSSTSSSSSDPPKLEVKMDAKKIVYIQNAVIKDANSPEELMELFNKGNLERHVAATKMNSESSRSHTIFAIMIESYATTSKRTTIGKLSLVDLAGSERANKTGASADRLKEAQSINKSLSALGDVIAALSEGEKFIPYRNNKLTQLMQDSLGGNAKTLMFVNFSPADYNVDETSTSLLYAARVKKIVNNPSKQAESEEVARLKAIIKRLQSGQAVAPDELDQAEAVEDAPVEKADDGKGYDGY